jgi:hypothetical protein
MLGSKDLFALWITKANSLLKVPLQFQACESSLLNSHGNLNNLLMCLVARSGLSHVGTTTPIKLQQFFTNEHLKKKITQGFFSLAARTVHNHKNLMPCFSFEAYF